jgi:broad specificity phosphatase PhoE
VIIYLVRHAEPDVKKGQTDGQKIGIGLSGFGRLQAKAVGKKIRKLGVEKLYSSPFTRASETAEIIGKEIERQVEFDDRLKEFITDPEEGDPVKQKLLKEQARSNPNLLMPSGESLEDAINRLDNFIEDTYRLPLEHVCVVTHRVVVEGWLSRYFNLRSDDHEWLRPASITAVGVSNEKKLMFANKVSRDIPLVLETLRRRLRLCV